MAVKKSELYSTLWKCCDELRGGMDASQYKDYVLVILFVKYISDKNRSDAAFDIEIPEGCYFEDFVALKGNPNIGEEINKKMQKLAEANQLDGVFVADFDDEAKLGKGKDKVETLSKLIAVFQNENLDFSKNRAADDDLIGDAYEYLMKNFATESGKSKGQFYTPAEVSRVMAKVIGLSNAKNGKRLPSGYYVTDQYTRHPYIRVIDMYDGGIDTSNLMYVPDEAYKPIEKYRIFKDDIFISVAGTLGIVGKIPDQLDGANLTENANRLTNITCNRDYLLYYLRSPYIQDVISSEQTIGAQPKLALMRIRNFDIVLPKDVAEQRAIEEALSDVDGLIAALDKKIAKKRLLKQGAMQQLLTGKKRLPGFTNKWVEKPIRLLCKLYGRIGFRGYTKADLVHKGEGAITFSPSDIHEQVISYTNCDYISWRKYDESPEIQVFNGDIIFCKTASIGKCAIIKNLSEKATINPQFVVLKDFKCNNEWLYYSIIDRKFQTVVSGITGGSTIPTMSQEKLYEQTLLCPPTIEEQQAIATILSDMDKEIADLEAQRDKYRLLKSGMMQKLLTGQIRLKTE